MTDSCVQEDGHLGLLQYQARSLILHSDQRQQHSRQRSTSGNLRQHMGKVRVYPRNHSRSRAADGSYLGKHRVDEANAQEARDVADTDAATDGGLKVEFWYYDVLPRKLDQVDWSADPVIVRIDPNIDYEDNQGSTKPWVGLDRLDMFAARWTGSLHITQGGTYTFNLGSDDGSKLMINDKVVVNHDGLHGFSTRSGEISLEPGSHSLQVDFFEARGRGAAMLSYSGPDSGGVMKVIPSSAFTPPSQSLLPPSPECPAECQSPSCVAGDFSSGGWLLDDGVCTVSCSEPNEKGMRQCGRGAAFESGDDSIDCSPCLKPAEQCGQCVLWGDPHIVPFDRQVLMRSGRGSNVNLYDYGDYWIVKSDSVFIQGRYWSSKYRGNAMTRGLAVGGPFLDGNLLMVEPQDGTVEWNG
eukprot:CAMPEP_0178433978 /NCGR_PEP_ID=MMETSP0689_2-20121128/33186_1 /TAXON_ID=160604 /ORGANISM="Amphidinium massartii, Strain CS-259" /LENGTH=410 /DNA_ID=CAMNT_0020056027 /DNA_START=185 /DNA_END=1413 /DNA_ORIENTATION=+